MANNFGNLLNRAVVLTLKLESDTLSASMNGEIEQELTSYVKEFDNAMNQYALKEALDVTFKFLDSVNLLRSVNTAA